MSHVHAHFRPPSPEIPFKGGRARNTLLGLVPCELAGGSKGASWLKCCFTSTETVGLLGPGAQDGHLDFHTAPELCDRAEDKNETL